MILIINSGSSSIKFGVYSQNSPPQCVVTGEMKRIGLPGVTFTFQNAKSSQQQYSLPVEKNYASAIVWLMDWLGKNIDLTGIHAIGHRLVHGMEITEPCLLIPEILAALKDIIPYDPDHLPGEIALIEAFNQYHPGIPQFACFDTSFHQHMPRVAKLFAIPLRFEKSGLRRYGFHGLSYSYLMKELETMAGADTANGRVVLAHLGSGASLAAVHQGQSQDTSMGFTPAGGIPMSSRSGDLDPGVAWFMMKKDNLSLDGFNHLINHECGLLGISETSGDMQDLLRQMESDPRSADAVNLFCYEVKKKIGAFAAVLGGLDVLVFSGGIGEKSPAVRQRICAGLEFLGIRLDKRRNESNDRLISAENATIPVYVLPTDEEWMIANIVQGMMAHPSSGNG